MYVAFVPSAGGVRSDDSIYIVSLDDPHDYCTFDNYYIQCTQCCVIFLSKLIIHNIIIAIIVLRVCFIVSLYI